MRRGGSSQQRRAIVITLLGVVLLIASRPAAPETSDRMEIELRASEGTLVMNSAVDLMVWVRDASTGMPVEGCDVVLHIERKGSWDSNGNGMDGHTHGEPIEVPPGVPVPSVDIAVTEDPKAGWNLRVSTADFAFAPQNASRENRWGEGHAHLYIDDEKIGRLYGEWFHISGLEAGTHTVRVTLNANDHSDISHDGQLVEDIETIVAGEPAPHGHMTARYEVPDDGTPVPTVDLTVQADPKSGWNLHIGTGAFRWAPENASTPPVMGEGHAHLYVDGHKQARLYCEWYHLAGLTDGSHEVRVTLSANNHSDYAFSGDVIDDIETIVVPPGAGDGTDGHGHGAVGIKATPTGKPGEYRLRHNFKDAGDYIIEVHVTGKGQEETAVTFEVEVLEGDPAALTIAGVIFYVAMAVAVIIIAQVVYNRRKLRRLREFGEGGGDWG